MPHGVNAPVPKIEIAYHAHPLRIGRPHCKMHSAHSINFPHVRALLLVLQVMCAFAREIQIVVGQQRREGVRIVTLPGISVAKTKSQPVGLRRQHPTLA